jgi:hypothetical protein
VLVRSRWARRRPHLFTRNRRYLTFAWRVLQFAFIFLIAFLALYVLERVVLVI